MLKASHCAVSVSLVALGMLTLPLPALAQSLIVPDDTLGDERSQVTENVNGAPIEVITGGAQREQNLFHSFEEFNVDEGRSAFFFSPEGLENIFSRVTGSNPSSILGQLGTFGDSTPDLYLMNPNGILFGPDSSLSVSGSFTATTADAIQFGNQNFFSAASPEAPSALLTVNPSAYLFNQGPNAKITLQPTQFLSADNVTLLGGDVVLDGGRILTIGGRIDIAGLAEAGAVELDNNGRLLLPDEQRSTIRINNEGSLFALDGGEIRVQVDQVTLDDGVILSNASETFEGSGADINIDARTLTLRNDSLLGILTDGPGTGGDAVVRVSESVEISDSLFANTTLASGAGGNIRIETANLVLSSEASSGSGGGILIVAQGTGNAGRLSIQASEAVQLDGSQLFASALSTGNAGQVTIETGRLSLSNGGVISSDSTSGGTGGDITVQARSEIVILGGPAENGLSSEITSRSGLGSQGDSGNIWLETGRLSILNGGNVSTRTVESSGNGGRLTVQARDVEVAGFVPVEGGFLASSIDATTGGLDAAVQGGELTIDTERLTLRDGGTVGVSVAPSSFGDAGALTIRATDAIVIDGVTGPINDVGDLLSARIDATVQTLAVGTGGEILLEAGQLILTNGGQVSATTFGTGDAGDIAIRADDIRLVGVSGDGEPSLISAQVALGATGNSGNIDISTESLEAVDGNQILASTSGEGDAGDIAIRAGDRITLTGDGTAGRIGGDIFSRVEATGVGSGGDISITTPLLEVRDGAQIATSTFGLGDAGGVTINARDRVTIVGTSAGGSRGGVFSSVGSDAVGDGGDIDLATTVLEVLDGAQLVANSEGNGDAGAITLNVRDRLTFAGTSADGVVPSAALSSIGPEAVGSGSDITITASDLEIRDGAQLSASTSGQGNAGNVRIVLSDSLVVDNSDITTQATAFAGGEITIRAADITLFGDSDIQTSVQSGAAGGGNITLTADAILAFDDSDILAFAAAGRGGNITLNTPAFFGSGFDLTSLTADPATLDGNNRVDINASGAVAGAVTLPDVSFIQNSLVDLPEILVDTESLIANSCVAFDADGRGTFVFTGSEGLPERPEETPVEYPTGDVQAIPDETSRFWRPGDPIVEPQDVYQLPNGELVLSHECQR